MNKYLKHTFLYPMAIALPLISANAITLADYGFDGVYTSSDSDTNTIASATTFGAGISPKPSVFSGTRVNGTDSVAVQHLTEGTAAEAITANDYMEFTISLNAGVEVDYSSLSVYLQRSNSPGSATNVFLRTSLDGYATTVGSELTPTTSFPGSPYSIDLSGSEFQNIASNITFRLYAYGGNNTSSSLRFDDLQVTGNVSVIPEPATAGLLMTGGALALACLRRKRKA